MVADGYEVDEERSATDEDWQQQRTQQHLLDPQLTWCHSMQNNSHHNASINTALHDCTIT